MFSRDKRTLMTDWWFTVDRELLAAFLLLLGAGVALSFAASPAVAEAHNWGTWYFVIRHILFAFLAGGVIIGMSILPQRWVRVLAALALFTSLVLLIATFKFGDEVKGARRWLSLGFFSLQPSELAKPAYAVVAAWFFAESMKGNDVPGRIIATGLMLILAGCLILQPDIGQTALVLLTWSTLLFLSGISWWFILALAGVAVVGAYAAYLFFPHVASRIDTFLSQGDGNTYQVEKALGSLREGGWFGRGPGEALTKRDLPDAHADYVFSAAAGEFGIIFCMALVALIAFIVFRSLNGAMQKSDLFARLAASTLAIQFGLQSAINLAVNLNLMPPKGMTLPFVSYGGTSMLAVAFGMGMMLSLMRKQPQEAMATGLPTYRSAVTAGAA